MPLVRAREAGPHYRLDHKAQHDGPRLLHRLRRGGFNLDRVAGAPALLMSFDPRFGLKMKGGCGGGGIYRIKPAASGITFRLQTASPEACKPLEEWATR